MPRTLTHPRDPSLILSASKPPFRAWQLRANGKVQRADQEKRFPLRLSDGSSSVVRIGGRSFDPFPVLIIDDQRYPLGRSIGITGALAMLLGPVGLVYGLPVIIPAFIGAVVTLRVVRTTSSPIVRIGTGLLVAFTGLWYGNYLNKGMGLDPASYVEAPAQPPIPMLAPLPDVPEVPPGMAARNALSRVPVSEPVGPLPAGSGAVPPFTVKEVLGLRSLVLAGEFRKVDSILDQLKAEARADVRREGRWRVAYRMTFQAMPDTFARMLDRWVETEPAAAAPRAARAWNRFWIAFYWRGEGTGDLTPARARGFINGLAHSADDAVEAIARDPDLLPAYWVLAFTARTEGDQEAGLAWISRALARSPSSFESRSVAMAVESPRWGGSVAAMQALADEAAPHVADNPDLARLRGYPHWMNADDQAEDAEGEGIPEARAALRFGQDALFYETLGHALLHVGEFEEARAMLDTAVALEPTFANAYLTRSQVLTQIAARARQGARPLWIARNADKVMVWTLRPLMEE